MIGFLEGLVKTKSTNSIILLVGGVGYEVLIPATTLQNITIDKNLELFIYTHVREDILALYGFKTQEELEMFKLLLDVSGIGPKTAMLVIDNGVREIKQAILNANADFFSLIPRLGRKNSQKIIIELKNKLGGLKDLDLSSESEETKEAIDALQSMGYQRQQAINILKTAPSTIMTLEQKIRFVLKNSDHK